jgi:hypothetical protein
MRSALHYLCLPVVLGVLLLAGCSPEHEPAGDLLYRRYCASCHGVQGKADGPVAASLKRPPSDLTTLARRSGGRFDERYVIAVIDGERLVAEHGLRDMPVWGIVFDKELRDEPYTGYTVLLRARLLSEYLRSIQEK